MRNHIADRIRKAHDRVAHTYGLSPVGMPMNPDSYDAWNHATNVVKPLSGMIGRYWKNAHVLDAGCGNGQIAAVLLDGGVATVTGVDFSENMLKQAVKRFHGRETEGGFFPVRANLECLDMIKGSPFDGAVLFGVLEHLDNPGTVIRSILGTLKPGAVLAVGVPRKGSLSHLSYMLFGDSPNRWGTQTSVKDRFRFQEKADFYRFFSIADMHGLLSAFPEILLLDRIPFAYCHLDGLPGYLLRLAGRNRPWGHGILGCLDRFCRFIGTIPAGEFWLLKKQDGTVIPGNRRAGHLHRSKTAVRKPLTG